MKKTAKILAAAITAVLLLCLCTAALADVVFAFDKLSYEVNVGKTLKLKPLLQGAETPKGAKYVWSTSDKTIATVSSGTVTGKKGGSVTITCQMQDGKKNVLYETSCEVTVFQPVKKIVMNPKKAVVMIVSPHTGPSYTYQLDATVSPADASNQMLVYTSLTPELLSVNSNGLVTTTKGSDGGKGYVQIEATDGSGVKVIQEIRCLPFIVTTKEIEMEERGVYRLRIPVSTNQADSLFAHYDLPEIIAKGSGYRMEQVNIDDSTGDITPKGISTKSQAVCWFDVRPLKAGTYTIKLKSGFMWSDLPCTYEIKIKVKDSAAYSTKTFPKLKYNAAMKDPQSTVGQLVSLEGRFIESQWDNTLKCRNYIIATGKGESDPVIVRTPEGSKMLDFVKSDKVTVYGAFGDPLEEKTETGLTLCKLVVDAEMINGICYNTDMHIIEMYDPAEANKKTEQK